eukprot:m.18948 g.18948  ORF g.18948 m.18948 type:complete len:62 (-) comp11648_c0_seq1:81-266(-)
MRDKDGKKRIKYKLFYHTLREWIQNFQSIEYAAQTSKKHGLKVLLQRARHFLADVMVDLHA